MQVTRLDIRRKRPQKRGSETGLTLPVAHSLFAILSLVAARNIVAYKGQGLPSSSALDFVLRLRDVGCTSNRPKDVRGL